MIALAVMAVGVLGLAAMLADSLAYMDGSQANFIAQQKAQQAVESIFTAKYGSTITWAQVANNSVGNPQGLFFSTAQPIRQPGPDGLVNSINDTSAPLDYMLYPGPDGKLGTADDIKTSSPITHGRSRSPISPETELADDHRDGELHGGTLHTHLHAEHIDFGV